MAQKVATKPAIPRPSSSVILVSPRNEILLLHRVQTSSSFPSAHVFPGGNLSPSQDGEVPPPEDPKRHDDAIHYRRAAIRELFEESGILLAKDRSTGQMVHVNEAERERGRHAIHREDITFQKWLQEQNSAAEPDTDSLIPFTHWITPTNLPKRFTTQMYLYFLPVPGESDKPLAQSLPAEGAREEIQVPTSDGGVEIMEARFLPACDWLQKARSGEIILFPPQFLLLHLISQFLDQEPRQGASYAQLKRRRTELLDFIHSGSPPWTHKYISPKSMKLLPDNRAVLALDSPGPELRGSDKKGETDRVILVRFSKEGARDLEVRWKKDILRVDSKSSL
ncbi:hypothetical protein VTN77DRAFT_3984 [Rasamsonia byssochlamydoides]|uniref:uncharacterized protein n=1 Tax=Rasamsonia byssochlamydoides TaxID=89139 RepID=UPI0037436A51